MSSNGLGSLVCAATLFAAASALRAQEASSPPLENWEAPGEWAFAAGAMLPTSPATFVGIVPCRMADTRNAAFPPGYGVPALAAGAPRNFVLTGRCGIPTTALAVSANVTAVNPPGPGFLLIRPTDGPNVVVSTLNFIPGQTIANGAVIPLGTGGAATFVAGVTGTELIIDVNGYYLEATGGGGDVTGVSAGMGLTGGGTSGDVTLAVDTLAIQSRVTGSCPAGESIRAISVAGGAICELDDVGAGTVTSVAAGTGLTGGPITTSGSLAVSFGGTGAASTASRSDHNHVGQTWNGTAIGPGLRINTTAINSQAFLGEATGANSDGVVGRSSAGDGIGVLGHATATSGQNYGVFGQTNSPSGYAGYFSGPVLVGGNLTLQGQLTSFATATVAATGDGVSNSVQLQPKAFCALTRMNQVGTVNAGTNYSCAISKSGSIFTLSARASSPSHTVTCDMACF